MHEQPVAPEIVDSRTPPALAAIIMRCLEKKPDDRYQRGNDLADALLAFLSDQDAPVDARASWLARLSGSAPVIPK